MSFFTDINKISTDLNFKEAVYNEKSKSLNVYLSYSDNGKEYDLESIKKEVSNLFSNVNTIIEIEVIQKFEDFNSEDILQFIKNFFEENNIIFVESNLTYDLSEEKLNLYFKNENSYETFKAKLYNNLKLKLKSKLGNRFNIYYKLDRNVDLKDILEKNKVKNNEIAKNFTDQINKIPKKDTENINNNDFYIGRKIKGDIINISDLNDSTYKANIEGQVFSLEYREIKNDTFIISFNIKDETDATTCKAFLKKDKARLFQDNIDNGDFVLVSGNYGLDSYTNNYTLSITSITKTTEKKKVDTSINKVELRCHTQMSSFNGFLNLESLIKRLKDYGQKAISITDQDSLQSFPILMDLAEKNDIKPIYGLDTNVYDDYLPIFLNTDENTNYNKIVVFDIETTGLGNNFDKITEIGAVKLENGIIVDKFSALINPEVPIPEKIMELTGITNEMVKDKPTYKEIIPKFIEFCRGYILAAHNAEFDISFIRTYCNKLNIEFNFPILDTLYLSRFILSDLSNHKLHTVNKNLVLKILIIIEQLMMLVQQLRY